ncbi:MAG: T9SS type A sorting domain-containing protein, partial [Crocinitomicaceae bacterium]|nr:T9SS type A sorting domain-containing protein [Crocinitomicaceae bacterium]
STDGNNSSNEILMGEDAMLDAFSLSDYHLNLDYTTTSEFGDVTKIDFYVGTENGEIMKTMTFPSVTGSATMSYQMDVLLDSILGVGNTLLDEYMYIRSELKSEVDYTGLGSEYKTSFDIFHSISNPIWFKYIDYAGINELTDGFVKVYPNPAEGILNFEFNSSEEKQIVVYDQTGRIVLNQSTVLQNEVLEILHLKSGMYYININVGNEEVTLKFVKL